MAVTLAQAALTEANPIRRGVLELFHNESALFDRLPLEPIEGNAYAYNVDEALPGTGFRTVNEAYIESTGVFNQRTETLSILGGDADVDRFLERTSGATLGSLRAQQTRLKVISAQSTYTDAFFNGDVNVNPKGFDGLKKRLVGPQVIDSAASTSDEAFLGELDQLFARVHGGTPDVVYAPLEIVTRLKTLARKVGGAEYVNSEITGKREFTWNGVEFVSPGEHWSGRRILGYDPVNGSDLYAVKFARSLVSEVGVIGIENGGIQAYDLGELQEKPVYRTRIDAFIGLAVQGGKAAARLRGVKTAA